MGFLEVSSEMSAGDLLVGVGTLLLAVFTAWLAFRTSRQVQLSRKSLTLNRESIEALDRPFVIATPNGHHNVMGFIEPGPDHPGMRFAYRLWNIGKGPAIVTNVRLTDDDARREYLTPAEEVQRPVATAPAGRDELSVLADEPPDTAETLHLRITYESANGRSYTTHSNVEIVENLFCICQDFRREPHDEG
jgi:hypothetical protein